MDAALNKHIGDRATWTVPAGGYFFWLTCAANIDTTALLDASAAAKVGFLPGPRCSSVGGLGNCLRLCFAHYGIPQIEEGIRRLSQVFDTFQ